MNASLPNPSDPTITPPPEGTTDAAPGPRATGPEGSAVDQQLDADRLMRQSAVVLRLGRLMLAAGAGSYRVKSSMARAAAAVGLDRHTATVTMTEIVTSSYVGDRFRTEAAEVRLVGVNVDRLEALRRIVHDLRHHERVEELDAELDRVAAMRGLYGPLTNALASGVACAGFCFLNHGGWVECLAVLVAACLGPLRRLGPLFLRPEQVQWWLPLPGDRSSLLRHLVRRELAVAWAASVGTGALIALINGGGLLGAAGWTVLAGGATGLALVALLASQVCGRPTAVVVKGRLAALLGVGACAGASLLVPLPEALAVTVPALLGALLALAAAPWWWRGPRRRLAGLADHSLRQASARAFGVQAAALAMDTRALGRMVSAPPRRPVRPAGGSGAGSH